MSRAHGTLSATMDAAQASAMQRRVMGAHLLVTGKPPLLDGRVDTAAVAGVSGVREEQRRQRGCRELRVPASTWSGGTVVVGAHNVLMQQGRRPKHQGDSRAVAARLDLVGVEVHVDDALVRLNDAVLEAGCSGTTKKRQSTLINAMRLANA